jgi:hypothetical protein
MSNATPAVTLRSEAHVQVLDSQVIQRRRPVRLWAATAVASLVAIIPALLLAHSPMVTALIVAAVLALALVAWDVGLDQTHVVLALVPATLVANSGLLPATTYFLPTGTLAMSLVGHVLVCVWTTRRIPPLPPRAFVVSAVLYLVAAAISTVDSIQGSTSWPYLVGMIVVVTVTVWLAPWVLCRARRAASLFGLIAAAGVATTLTSVVLSVTGPTLWFDRWLGVYLANELTINNHPTGLVLLRASGPFLNASVQGLALAPALLALLALRRSLGPVGRWIAAGALILVLGGLILTLARASWAAVIVGSALLALWHRPAGQIDRASALVCIAMSACFAAMLANLIGADYRPDVTENRNQLAREAAAVASGIPIQTLPHIPEPITPPSVPAADGASTRLLVRGGSDLSGRIELWTASIRAIADSPWFGYGPGTDAIVLAPFVREANPELVGLTSHNTWLRTWLEMGILGVVALTSFAVVTLNRAIRVRTVSFGRQPVALGALAIFVGLIVAQQFETFLLGGVSLPSFVWSLSAGMLAHRSPEGIDGGSVAG